MKKKKYLVLKFVVLEKQSQIIHLKFFFFVILDGGRSNGPPQGRFSGPGNLDIKIEKFLIKKWVYQFKQVPLMVCHENLP